MVRFELMVIFFVKLTKMWTKFGCKDRSIITLKIGNKFSFAKYIFTTDVSSLPSPAIDLPENLFLSAHKLEQ